MSSMPSPLKSPTKTSFQRARGDQNPHDSFENYVAESERGNPPPSVPSSANDFVPTISVDVGGLHIVPGTLIRPDAGLLIDQVDPRRPGLPPDTSRSPHQTDAVRRYVRGISASRVVQVPAGRTGRSTFGRHDINLHIAARDDDSRTAEPDR